MITKKIENSTEKISYKLDLTCSFIRTHFVINDLLLTGDIIEAATLIRKQLESLTRLIEIDAHPLSKLLRKTPNVCHVLKKMGKSLYPELSEIAHSGTPLVGKLIVQNESGTDKTGPSIYPVFDPLLYEFYKRHCFISIVWTYWTIGFLKEVYKTGYNSQFDEEIIDEIFLCALANGIIIETKEREKETTK